MNEIERQYLVWMYVSIFETLEPPMYVELFEHLYHIPFTYTIQMDANRFDDGINLRYLFGQECGYSDVEIAHALDTKPCSVLEMIFSLAQRIEDYLVDDARGSQLHVWFCEMLQSLGLDGMYLDQYDSQYVDSVITRLLNHTYERSGRGGLFQIHDPIKDQRNVEIWTQANRWVSEYVRSNF